ncbi:hypothetical protein SLEP1_g6067 [Rubroshorea leprosula]|uniref:Uncharacterized protein n=1 Tax=Rubroshorea leprosula TaxID=152421 RepID=A0AAV5I3N5_9ROSI|nr:hypothetical protein SLEP1_g6067 [Rubroshorea leprosula]
MDKGIKGITWAGNLCRRLEAVCVEAESIRLEASGLFQETVQEVQQFFSALMEDVLPSSPQGSVEDCELMVAVDADVTNDDNSVIDVEEDHSKKELLHSSHRGTVEDDGPVVGGADASVTDHDNSDVDVEEDHSEKELRHSTLVDFVEVPDSSSSSEKTSGSGTLRKLKLSINGNEDLIKEEEIQQKAVCKSFMETGEGSCSASSSSSTASSISETLIQSCKAQLPDTGFTLDNSVGESSEEASHNVVDKSELNLEESCIIVDSSLLQSLYSEAGRCKFYKGASPTKMRIRKRPLANFHKDGNLNVGSNQQKGNSFEQSFLIVESEAPEQEFSGSDWEII